VKTIGRTAVIAVLVALLGAFIYWQMGGFTTKIEPPGLGAPSLPPRPAAGPTVAARQAVLPVIEEAVGTIQSRHRVDVSPQIQATILEVRVNSGDKVQAGDLLALLDPRDLDARLGQADQAVKAAEATHNQALADLERSKKLRDSNVISSQESERAFMLAEVTSASLGEAHRGLEQAKVARSYAEIHSPVAGVIVEKQQQAGDTAMPGKPIVSLYDPNLVRLEAPVRETAARDLKVGYVIAVRMGTEDRATTGVIDEIVPQADVPSRSILVRVLVSGGTNLYSGMYGRLLIRTGEEKVTLVPRDAVTRVGQLEFAYNPDGAKRFIQTGRTVSDSLEVLAGLNPGEEVLASAQAEGRRP
jgi:membrane fusion protein, multidrug efflux system